MVESEAGGRSEGRLDAKAEWEDEANDMRREHKRDLNVLRNRMEEASRLAEKIIELSPASGPKLDLSSIKKLASA